MIPVNHSFWEKRLWIARIVTKFQSDCIINKLTAYDQIKSGRARAVKNGKVFRRDGATDSNTVLFSSRNDTTWYFKPSETRRISPECITGFSIQITHEILRGDSCRRAYGKYLEILAKVRSWISRQQRQKTNGSLPSWEYRLREPYSAYNIKIILENGTGICKMHSTFITGRWLRT